MDLSKIQHLFLKENYLLGLNFPAAGIMPLRVLAREILKYKYQAVSITNEGVLSTTGTIAADTQIDPSRLTLSTYNIDNVLRVTDPTHIYQVFVGIKPSAIRQFLYYPLENGQRGLDIKDIFTKAPYGFVSGFDSPYDSPSELTEMWIPQKIDVGFAWYNPLKTAEELDVQLLVVKYLIEVVRDTDTVEGIIQRKIPARIATLGGIKPITYDARTVFDADLIKFTANKDAITKALSIKR